MRHSVRGNPSFYQVKGRIVSYHNAYFMLSPKKDEIRAFVFCLDEEHIEGEEVVWLIDSVEFEFTTDIFIEIFQ